MLKFYKGLSPPIMDYVFKTVYYVTGSMSYVGQNIQDILTEKVRNMENLENFKKKIKT